MLERSIADRRTWGRRSARAHPRRTRDRCASNSRSVRRSTNASAFCTTIGSSSNSAIPERGLALRERCSPRSTFASVTRETSRRCCADSQVEGAARIFPRVVGVRAQPRAATLERGGQTGIANSAECDVLLRAREPCSRALELARFDARSNKHNDACAAARVSGWSCSVRDNRAASKPAAASALRRQGLEPRAPQLGQLRIESHDPPHDRGFERVGTARESVIRVGYKARLTRRATRRSSTMESSIALAPSAACHASSASS